MNKQLSGWLIGGGLFGAVTGGLIGLSYGATWLGVLIGAVTLAIGEALTGLARPMGQAKPFWYRLLTTAFFSAAGATLLARLFPGLALPWLGALTGLFWGMMGFRLATIPLGLLVGAGLGLLTPWLPNATAPVVLGGLVALVYRLLNAAIFREREPLELNAEAVPKEQVRYVVPFEANSGYVGADFFSDLARIRGGAFRRDQPDIGIVASLDDLQGPHFDPARVHPLIREFYEHTSRFKLQIEPEWDWRYRPLFWWFKRAIAQPLGQANLPFDVVEAQRGVVSYIDTIDFSCDEIIDLRGWVRAFEGSGEAIYVGVYTTFRFDGAGYVSVGFPLPESNFTATLLPYNLPDGNFILRTTGSGLAYPGHYLSTSAGSDNLTVLKLPTFDEEIEVFVKGGDLFTQHRFYIGGRNFLKLHYSMARKPSPDGQPGPEISS